MVVRQVPGGVAPECQDVLDSGRGVAVEDRGEFGFGVADAGQVRDGRQMLVSR